MEVGDFMLRRVVIVGVGLAVTISPLFTHFSNTKFTITLP